MLQPGGRSLYRPNSAMVRHLDSEAPLSKNHEAWRSVLNGPMRGAVGLCSARNHFSSGDTQPKCGSSTFNGTYAPKSIPCFSQYRRSTDSPLRECATAALTTEAW